MNSKSISSPENAEYKEALKLLDSTGIKKQKKFFIFGKKIISELIKKKIIDTGTWWLSEDHKDLDIVVKSGLETRLLSKKLFSELDVLGSNYPLLQLNTPNYSELNEHKPQNLCLVLACQDPQNLGAILRSACAFGVTEVVLLKECANPFLPKAIRAASGSTLHFKFISGPSIKDLKLSPLYALDMEGTPLKKAVPQLPPNFYLLAGEEGQGVPDLKNLKRLSITTQKVESLNVGVAIGIFLHEWHSN